ncbi:hypothetical protein IV72_GL000345 [Atopobium minutum]|nr:hypothetical protein IV72_GL000345 [Atopobium minutum]
MPHAVGDGQRRVAELDEKAHVAVAQVVDADGLHAACFAAAAHLRAQEAFGVAEYPLVLGDAAKAREVVAHLLGQELGHHDGPHRFPGLRGGDHVLAADALVGFRHRHRAAREVEVPGRERQQLAHAHAAPVQYLERHVGRGLVAQLAAETQVLVLGPEVHLVGVLLADLADLPHGVGCQAVVPHGVVHDGGELVADAVQIGRAERQAVAGSQFHQLVFPGDDVRRGDLVDGLGLEVGQDLRLDHRGLGVPGASAQARGDVLPVDPVEVGEGHGRRPLDAQQEIVLPPSGGALAGEAALGLLALLALPVAVPALHVIGAPGFVLANRHFGLPFQPRPRPCCRHRGPPRRRSAPRRSCG